MNPNAVNLVVLVVYLLGVLTVGLVMKRYIKTVDDFFLAGRALNHWVIAGSIIATNVAAVWLIGPAGTAYKSGASTILIAWSGNMIAAFSALVFVPRYRRLRITTITEILETRYGVGVRILPVIGWLIYYTLFAGTAMYTFSLTMKAVLGWRETSIILVIGPLVVAYCFAGGLLAVVFTDVVQAFLIILGGLIVLPLALKAVGGIPAFVQRVPANHFLLWSSEGVSWKQIATWIVTGLPFWCTSQYMLQRTFGGRTVKDSARGLALAGILTGPLTLTYILAGLCGALIYTGPHKLANPDMVLPSMLRDILPVGLGGLFLAALVAASNSTASSLLNSIATLFENDIYRRFRPGRPERHYTWMGRVATLAAGAGAILFAVALAEAGRDLLSSIYLIMVIVEPPVFVIVAGALFWKKPSGLSAGITFVTSVLINFLMFRKMGWAGYGDIGVYGGLICVAVFVVTSLLIPNSRREQTEEMHRRMRVKHPPTPTPVSKAGAALAVVSLALFIVCALFETHLPKPGNIFIFLALMILIIFGVLMMIPGFVAEEELSVEQEQRDQDSRREIDASIVSRLLGSWKTWAVVYLFGGALTAVLYYL